jgi:CRISPR-associated protein Csd1
VIIQSLCQYYDILDADENVTIARPGYSRTRVSFVLVISRDGELTNIVDLRSSDKKPQPKEMEVPLQTSRSNGIVPHFLCDNAKYVFGVEKLKKDIFKEKFVVKNVDNLPPNYTTLKDDGKDVVVIHPRSREYFEAFRNLHHDVLDSLDDGAVKSFLKFLDTWKPELFLNNPKIVEYLDDILNGGLFVFECGGIYLHKNSEVRQAWQTYSSSDPDDTDESTAQCLVTGKMEQVARLHQKIKGFYGKNVQTAGASLVSFNNDAFCSYGKDQSYNAPISTSAMFKYTTVLNHLLDHGSRSKLQIADTTTVFWAETSNVACVDLTLALLNPSNEKVNSPEEVSEVSRIEDKAKHQLLSDILKKVKQGQRLQEPELGASPETNFYILGLSPNNARVAVRFWYVDKFGNFISHIARHHLDMEIIGNEIGQYFTSVYRLLNETIPKSSEKSVVSPLLGGLVMRSILNNTMYPAQMYSAILNRVKVERSINYVRAGFIKAYLLRSIRLGSTKIKEDLITVSLNKESQNVPYRLGRLFAVLEKAQNDASNDMKSTINSKYFSSASTTPAVVFPVLLKLAQHHIAKSDWGFKSTQSIEEILSGVDEFPSFLNLEEQGMFMLGYYHQHKDFFKKKEVVTGEES